MIPRIIHQIWIGPYDRPAEFMETWRTLNPSFRYELWDDTRCAAFGFQNAHKIAEQSEWAGKADLMRYEILERHGGIFIDADAECVRPLEDHFLDHDSFACWENETIRHGLISNGYLGASINNKLMQALISAAAYRNMRGQRAWLTTGPMLLTQTVKLLNYTNLHVYPSFYFIPRHYSGMEYHGRGPVYAKQHWGSTLNTYELSAGTVSTDTVSTGTTKGE